MVDDNRVPSLEQVKHMPLARGRFFLIGLIVSVLAALAFIPGLPGGFIFDDVPNIENNAAIRMERWTASALTTSSMVVRSNSATRPAPAVRAYTSANAAVISSPYSATRTTLGSETVIFTAAVRSMK